MWVDKQYPSLEQNKCHTTTEYENILTNFGHQAFLLAIYSSNVFWNMKGKFSYFLWPSTWLSLDKMGLQAGQ